MASDKILGIVERLEADGCDVTLLPLGCIDSASGELTVVEVDDSEGLCGMLVKADDQEAHVSFYDDGHVHSLFILTDDEILLQRIADQFFPRD